MSQHSRLISLAVLLKKEINAMHWSKIACIMLRTMPYIRRYRKTETGQAYFLLRTTYQLAKKRLFISAPALYLRILRTVGLPEDPLCSYFEHYPLLTILDEQNESMEFTQAERILLNIALRHVPSVKILLNHITTQGEVGGKGLEEVFGQLYPLVQERRLFAHVFRNILFRRSGYVAGKNWLESNSQLPVTHHIFCIALRSYRYDTSRQSEWYELLNYIIKRNPTVVNPTKPRRLGVFHQAARTEITYGIKWLIDEGCDIDITSDPVIYLYAYNFELVKLLFAHGADLNATRRSFTALHLFAYEKDRDRTVQLIELGANCNVVDKYGRVPLVHWYIPRGARFHSDKYQFPTKFNDQPGHLHRFRYEVVHTFESYLDIGHVTDRAPRILFENTPRDSVRAMLQYGLRWGREPTIDELALVDHILSQYPEDL